MGLSYLVYPGAHHTRFHHALGCLHLMQKAVQILSFKGVSISKEEENAVYDALDELGVAGTNEIHFWLGLRQISNLNPNNNVYEGWQWLDGRLLTEELANWSPPPNGGGIWGTH